jgi:hypothetical protein
MLPFAATNAFLQSIIPAPVACLSLFTSAAVMFAIFLIFLGLLLKKVVQINFSVEKNQTTFTF